MARAAKLDLRTFQQELATRLASKTAAQVESSRLGLSCGGEQWLIRLADAGEVVAVPPIAPVPLTQAVVPRPREHPRQPLQRHRLRAVPRARQRSPGVGQPARAVRAARRRPQRGHRRAPRVLGLAQRRRARARGAAATEAPAWYAQRWIDARRQRMAGDRPREARPRSGVPAGRTSREPQDAVTRHVLGGNNDGAQDAQAVRRTEGEARPVDADLDMPTTQVKMSRGAQSGYDPLASVSVMEQLRAATAKSVAPWKLPLIGDLPVVEAVPGARHAAA